MLETIIDVTLKYSTVMKSKLIQTLQQKISKNINKMEDEKKVELEEIMHRNRTLLFWLEQCKRIKKR